MRKRLITLISVLLMLGQVVSLMGCAGGGLGGDTTTSGNEGTGSVGGSTAETTSRPDGSESTAPSTSVPGTSEGTTSGTETSKPDGDHPVTSDPNATETEGPGNEEDPPEGDAQDGYVWSTVPMGAGGFVTGVIIHPTEPNLVYVRTDVGGCYRWDKENDSWIQLMDMFPRSKESFYAVDGLALDANNPDVIYIAAGSTVGSGYSDVLKSTDRGLSWDYTGLTTAIKKTLRRDNSGFEGNGTYRGSGERIAVDPANGNIVYVGTINGGVWKSTDAGETWSEVNLPNVPSNGSGLDVRNIYFDPSTSVKGDKTMTIYIGTVSKGVCRSTDGGKTWTQLSGSPATVNRMSMGKTGGILYAAALNGLFRLEGNTWKDISPLGAREYGGVSVNPLNEKQLVCSIPHPTGDGEAIWISNDGGNTWTDKHSTSTITSTLPWNPNPNINANGHCIEMDWNKQGRVWNTDWFCATRTDDITANAPQWKYLYEGIEEICPRNLLSPPSGDIKLFISVADNRGFMYADTSKYPYKQLGDWNSWYQDKQPGIMSIGSTAICYEDPNFVGIAGVNWNFYGKVELSTDGGKTWKTVKGLPAYVDDSGNELLDGQNCREQIQYGSIVLSSQKQANGYPVIIIVPTYEQAGQGDHLGRVRHIPAGYESKPILVSKDWGETWEKVTFAAGEHIMKNHWHGNLPITADKVAGNKFYAIGERQQVYYSEDWGMTWEAGDKISDGWNYPLNEIKSAPYIEGEVWATMGVGLYRSSDGGKTFTQIRGITETVGFGFGKNAPGSELPTVFVYGVVNGVDGIYRSLDMGKTWERINPATVMIGKSPNVVEGDMQEFGTVYVTSGGRGVYCGRDTGRPEEVKTEYHSSFVEGADLSEWSFYLNGNEGNNDFKASAADYLANSKMTASGAFMWQESSNFPQRQDCIYNGISFSGKYYYQVFMRDDSNGSAHKNVLYFNYIDKDNCYKLVVPNDGTMKLYKVLGGEALEVASVSATGFDLRAGATVKITYDNGSIKVESIVGDSATALINCTDSSPFTSGGMIGVGSENAIVGYKDIHACPIK